MFSVLSVRQSVILSRRGEDPTIQGPRDMFNLDLTVQPPSKHVQTCSQKCRLKCLLVSSICSLLRSLKTDFFSFYSIKGQTAIELNSEFILQQTIHVKCFNILGNCLSPFGDLDI